MNGVWEDCGGDDDDVMPIQRKQQWYIEQLIEADRARWSEVALRKKRLL